MDRKIINHQCAFALRQRGARLSFCALLVLVLINFTTNVFQFQGLDVLAMYHPAKLLLLSVNRTLDYAGFAQLLVQLYPILVVCPAGFLLVSEKNRKESLILMSRAGITKYYVSSAVSSFLVTALVFTVPFLLELLLNLISFPLEATGDFWGYNKYSAEYAEITRTYILSGLYYLNPYLYTVVGILLFGVFSGVLGMFTTALAAVLRVRYKVLMFLPVFVLLNLTLYATDLFNSSCSLGWFHYVFLFDDYTKADGLLWAYLLAPAAAAAVCIGLECKCDQL